MEELPRLPLVEGSPDPERKKSKEKKKKDDKTRPVTAVPGNLLQIARDERKEPTEPKPLDDRLKELFGRSDETSHKKPAGEPEDGVEPSQDEAVTLAPDEVQVEPADLKPYEALATSHEINEVPLGEAGREEEIVLDHGGVDADEIHVRPHLAEGDPEPPASVESEPELPPLPGLTPGELVPMEPEPAAELPPEPEPGAGHGGAGGGGEAPPPHGPEDGIPDPEPLPPPLPPLNPAETSPPVWAHPAEAAQPLVVNANPSAEQLRTHQQEVANAARRGESRGWVGGLFLGLAIEHIRHRRRERKTARSHRKEQRQLQQRIGQERVTTQQQFGRQEVAQNELSHKLRTTETVLATSVTAQERLKREVEKATLTGEKLSVQPAAPHVEQLPEEEPVALPADRRVESSSWHRIEIDARTGKPVEQPVVEYGQEFQRELSHEARPADLVAANSIGTSIVGSVVGSDQPTASAAPSPHTDPAIQSILQPPSTPPPILTSHPTSPRPTNDAPLGLWIALVIIVLAIIAALILR